MTEKLVIIGNGMAPGRMLEHLLEKAPGRYQVTIFNAEPRVNYDRIMRALLRVAGCAVIRLAGRGATRAAPSGHHHEYQTEKRLR